MIVADRLYSYDEGKVVAEPGEEAEFLHDLAHVRPRGDVEDGRRVPGARDRSRRARRRAARRRRRRSGAGSSTRCYAHEAEGGPAPASHPDRKRACPGWTERAPGGA